MRSQRKRSEGGISTEFYTADTFFTITRVASCWSLGKMQFVALLCWLCFSDLDAASILQVSNSSDFVKPHIHFSVDCYNVSICVHKL